MWVTRRLVKIDFVFQFIENNWNESDCHLTLELSNDPCNWPFYPGGWGRGWSCKWRAKEPEHQDASDGVTVAATNCSSSCWTIIRFLRARAPYSLSLHLNRYLEQCQTHNRHWLSMCWMNEHLSSCYSELYKVGSPLCILSMQKKA